MVVHRVPPISGEHYAAALMAIPQADVRGRQQRVESVNSLAIPITAVTVQQVLGLRWTFRGIGAGGIAPRDRAIRPEVRIRNGKRAINWLRAGSAVIYEETNVNS